jgi:dolichol-phosphate mannosyltransferase
MKYVVVLPTYNEAENIEKIISLIMNNYDNVSVLVVDDNSPDGTFRIVNTLLPVYPRLSLLLRKEKQGLGKAYTEGFIEVIKDPLVTHVFMMDADMSHDPKYIVDLIQKSNSFDLVIGSRYVKNGKTIGWELWRKVLSFLGNIYARTITRLPIYDMTGGFNCININYLKKIDLDTVSSSGYAFIMELKYALYKKGATVTEVPITFVNRFGGESKISNNIISEGILAPWKMILRK